MGMFRELLPEEIECRVGRVTNNGVELLLYKDARVDAKILDEKFGPMNWQCRFEDHKGTMFCYVGIRSNDGEWVWKSDAGAPSNMEAVKGEASDAFKRACFKWGIGRELYSSPRIFVYADKCKRLRQNDKGKWQCYDRFSVAKIAIIDGKIKGVRIVNEEGRIVFSWRESVQDGGKQQ